MRGFLTKLPVLVVIASSFGLIAPPAVAQRTTFDPRIELFWRYTDNVLIVETGDAGSDAADTSDQLLSFDVDLPVTRTTRFGSVGFEYRGRYEKYDRFGEYDNLAHTASFNLTFDFDENTSLRWVMFGTFSQNQSVPRRIDEQELFLTIRTNREIYGTEVIFEKTTRRDWWRVWGRLNQSTYTEVDGTIPEQPPIDPSVLFLIPEDRELALVRFEYRRALSRRLTMGPVYDFGLANLERNGRDLYNALGLYTGWSFTKFFRVGLTVGRFIRQQEGNVDQQSETVEESAWYWTADIRIEPTLEAFQKGKLRLGTEIGIRPSGGGALGGTSTNTLARIYIESGTNRSPWSWQVGARYTRRESTLEGQPNFETAGLYVTAERILATLLSLRVGLDGNQQIDSLSDSTNAAFATIRFGIVIYPTRRTGRG